VPNLALPHLLVPGTPNNVNHVQENDNALRDKINGNINGDNLSADVLGVWRPLLVTRGFVTGSIAVGTYALEPNAGTSPLTTNGFRPALWWPISADVAVAGRTARLRLAAILGVNTIAPGATLTVELRRITAIAGGAADMSLTVAAAALSVAFATPAASARSRGASSEIDLTSLAADPYLVTVSVSGGTTVVNSMTTLSVALELRHT
jgi:hypothetical protein